MKKNLCKILNSMLILSLMLHIFMPLTVLADTTIVLSFTVEDNTKFALDDNNGLTISKLSGGSTNVNIMSGGADISFDNEVTYNCTSQVACSVTITGKSVASLRFDPSFADITVGENLVTETTTFTANTSLTIKEHINNQNNNNPVEPGPDGPRFDGKAYILWPCKSGGICMYHFDNIPNFDDGNSTFYKASEIVDDRTHETFNINAQYKAWATDEKFDNWVNAYKAYKNISTVDWSKVDPKDMIGDPVDMRQYEEEAETSGACTKEGKVREEFEDCVNQFAAKQKGVWVARAQLQPVGEPTYNNSYVSYGDRNFKVVIYNDNYKGVSIGSLADLNYYPAEWANPFIKRDQYDISGTTKDKPTGIDTILLEKTVNIKVLNYNGFEIVKLEALDVPEKAVKIEKVDGEWKLTFSSNFYDQVVFKATDNKGEESYFMIKRYTIDGYFINKDNKPYLNADFFYDKNKSYSDFELTAKIIYKDGTEKRVKLEASKGIDDGLGNITDAYEVSEEHDGPEPSGKGLKKASFRYALKDGEDREIKKIYLNAEYKGSTDTNYAGAFTGSGKGVLANIYTGEE